MMPTRISILEQARERRLSEFYYPYIRAEVAGRVSAPRTGRDDTPGPRVGRQSSQEALGAILEAYPHLNGLPKTGMLVVADTERMWGHLRAPAPPKPKRKQKPKPKRKPAAPLSERAMAHLAYMTDTFTADRRQHDNVARIVNLRFLRAVDEQFPESNFTDMEYMPCSQLSYGHRIDPEEDL